MENIIIYKPIRDCLIKYICPHCFRMTSFKIVQPSLGLIISKDKEHDIELGNMELDFTIRCVECDDYMFKADNNIADYIPLFNKYGIKTLFSCDGHIIDLCRFPIDDKYHAYDYSLPYLSIDADIDEDVLNFIKDSIKDEPLINIEEYEYDDGDYIIIRGGRSIDNYYTDDEINDEEFMKATMNESIYKFKSLMESIAEYLERRNNKAE